jgi:hypothetical protein
MLIKSNTWEHACLKPYGVLLDGERLSKEMFRRICLLDTDLGIIVYSEGDVDKGLLQGDITLEWKDEVELVWMKKMYARREFLEKEFPGELWNFDEVKELHPSMPC